MSKHKRQARRSVRKKSRKLCLSFEIWTLRDWSKVLPFDSRRGVHAASLGVETSDWCPEFRPRQSAVLWSTAEIYSWSGTRRTQRLSVWQEQELKTETVCILRNNHLERCQKLDGKQTHVRPEYPGPSGTGENVGIFQYGPVYSVGSSVTVR